MFGLLLLDRPIVVIRCAVVFEKELFCTYVKFVNVRYKFEVKMQQVKMTSKNRHYTPIERKLFLEILKSLAHVIELKKSDSSTLREKEVAWTEICKQYNDSHLITQKRDVQQLKKLWTNLKQTQRETLTKERQSRLATGGGPEDAAVEIDPDVASIAPNLLKTAPVIFSSNADSNEMDDQYQQIVDGTSCIIDVEDAVDTIVEMSQEQLANPSTSKSYAKRGKKRCLEDLSKGNGTLRKDNILKYDEEMANTKIAHEKRMAEMKEDHLKEMQELELAHKKELYNLEIRAATALALKAELLLKKEQI